MNDDRCKETVYPNEQYGSFHGHRCTRKAVKDGYCKIHHPDAVEERRKKSYERFEARREKDPIVVQAKKIKELEDKLAEAQITIEALKDRLHSISSSIL